MCAATGSERTDKNLKDGVGYGENDTGFGWTITDWIDAVRAIPRLFIKIDNKEVPEPTINSNFVIKEHGRCEPAKDTPEFVRDLYERAKNLQKSANPFIEPKDEHEPIYGVPV